MIFFEPSATPYDLCFRVAGFPVRVHPMFWVVSLLLSNTDEPRGAAIWVGAVFISIVVHELGHAVLQRRNGGRPRIVLYGMGGLAISDDTRSNPWTQVLISLAGPAAGFLFALALGGATWAMGMAPHLRFSPLPPWVDFRSSDSVFADKLLWDLFNINILWGLLNLAPIYPLDGGRVSRELLTLWLPPSRGVIASLWLSIGCAAAIAAYFAWSRGMNDLRDLWPVLMFGLMAYSNYQALQSYQQSRGGGW